jgi:hypothetical protein
MPQFNGKQEGKPANGVPNLRCPRNGKRTNFSRNSTPITRSHWARLNSAPGKAMEVDPQARIPANTVAARPKERAAVTPNVLAGKPVRVLKRFRPS